MTTILGAVARELDDISYQIVALQDLWDIDTASGEDLDARAADCNPDEIVRKAATYATGIVHFIRSAEAAAAATGVVTIPYNTKVSVAGGEPAYLTATASNFAMGDETSTPVSAVAVSVGVAANADIASVVELTIPIAGADSVTNTTAMRGGQDQETDAQLRERIKSYLRSLARGTPDAIRFAVLGTTLDDYGRINVVQVWEEPEPYLGHVKVYCGDGNGTIERTVSIVDTTDSDGDGVTDSIEAALLGTTPASTLTPADSVIGPASGGEIRVRLDKGALIDDGSAQVWWYDSGGTYATGATTLGGGEVVVQLTEGDPSSAAGTYDFILNYATGVVTLYTGGPSTIPDAATAASGVGGLQAGDSVAAVYTHYEGLLLEAQKIIDGDPDDRESYPGYRAAGTYVKVYPPTVFWQTYYVTIVVESGYTASTVTASVASAIEGYVNGLGINADVIASELIYACQTVEGVFDVTFTDSAGTAIVLTNNILGEGDIARTSSDRITVTGA